MDGRACGTNSGIYHGRATLSSKLTTKVDDDEYFIHRGIFSLLWINNLHKKYLAQLRKVGPRYFMEENEPNVLGE